MLRIILGLALVALVCGCSGEPELSRPDTGPQQEKTILAALSKVAATDEEKVAILNAYDRSNDHLRDLARQSRRILSEWRGLDRRAPEFSARVDALATQWAELNSEEMKIRAGYEHEVAAALSPKQWDRWQSFIRSSPVPRNSDDYGGPGQIQRRSP